MVLAIFAIIILVVLWALFVEGWLWRIILFFSGWFGIFMALNIYVPESRGTAITFDGGGTMSWAAVVASTICIMALLTTRVKSE